ncbi:non-ribosomal peptide synthetase [Hamadaea tsunoensis]|uniref:non-ribosomal peptide synthetase n=1 Tax=Hamadaea tsunoensis TaxID=53368 RepID=UPI0004209BB5|nr:non-ribosomal peptide synthetase [Hamadaea tsunoensis]
MTTDLFTRLTAHAAADPARPALTFLTGPARVELGYGELVARVGDLAGRLAYRFGRGERILLVLPAGADFAVAFLACVSAGLIAVPLPVPTTASARRRLFAAAADSRPAAVLSLAAVRDTVTKSAEEHPLRDVAWLLTDADAEDTTDRRPLPAAQPDELAFLQYTSGSTAAPRGVMVSHGALLANEAAIRTAFGVTADSTIVSWLPPHHDMGLIGGLLQPLYAGARGVILDPLAFLRRPARWLQVISDERADISGAPNFAYDLCVRTIDEEEKQGLDLSRWRVAFNGAAPVHPQTLRAFSAAFAGAGFRASAHVPCYGLAEATLLVARGSGTATTFSAAALEQGRAMADPAGDRDLIAYDPPPHAQVRVVDPATAAPAGDGEVGEIVVAGPSNGTGYWGDPERTAGTFGLVLDGAGPFVRTGDLGFVHDGRLYVSGRHKDVIIHRGRNLHPEDLEVELADSDPAVRTGRAAIFSVSSGGDEAVVAVQELRPGTPAERHAVIAGAIRAAVARAHDVAVRTVVLSGPNSVAMTTSGKVERHTVRRRFLAGELRPLFVSELAAPQAAVTRLADRLTGHSLPPDTEAVAVALAEHLRDVLGLPEVPATGVAPASLGVDSLLAVQLHNELAEALGVALRPTLMLRSGSIMEIAETACRARTAEGRPEAPQPDGTHLGDGVRHPEYGDPRSHDTAYELTETQRALWFLQRAYPDNYSYNVTRAFRLTGAVDPDRVAAALDAVTARHPSLRLAVHSVDGGPRATVAPTLRVALHHVDGSDVDSDRWVDTFATTPFDLEHDPVLRAALVRRPADWLLVLSLHHIACDVASLTVLLADFLRAYAGDVLGPSVAAPAARERRILDDDGERLSAYWKELLAGELPSLALPRLGGQPQAAGQHRGAGAALAATVPGEVSAALSRWARERGLTLHNVLLAAYQVLLHRLTGQSDLLVGVPTMGRDDRRTESWVGYLVNAVPVRSRYRPGCGFEEFAQQTQRSVLDALDHRDLPLSAITRLAAAERPDAASTLFQAMFEYYTTALPGGAGAAAAVLGDTGTELPLGAAVLSGHPLPERTAQSDLSMNVAVVGDRVELRMQYSTEKVTAEQAGQVLSTFDTLLRAVAEQPRRALRSLPVSSAAELRRSVALGTGAVIERTEHYVQSFERYADTAPDVVAVDDGTTRLTYAQLDRRANHVAERLRAYGVGTDRTVVVCAARSAAYVTALVGIHKADGAYVPISPTEAPRRAEAMVRAVRPAVCIVDETGRDLLSAALPEDLPALVDFAELTGGETAVRPGHDCFDEAAGFVIHTSGSTGTPKSVVVTNLGMTNHIWQMMEHFGAGPGDCLAQTAPVSFDISVWQLLAPLAVGGRIRVVTEPSSLSPAALLRAVRDGGVTILELVPSMIIALLDAGLAADPGVLRVMISTGDSLTDDVADRWRTELPEVPLFNAYGPAECSDDVTMGLCAHGTRAPISPSIGRPLANTSVLVLDDRHVPVPAGVVGTLCVGGIAVGRGYLGDPRRTAEVFVPDPWSATPGARMYVTGDLGRVAPEGDLAFLGRADTQIKLRGIRIEAGEVEAALRAAPGVGDAVVKVERGASGPVLVGYIVIGAEEPGTGPGETRLLDPAEETAIRTGLAQRLPRQMIPTVLVRVARLPRSANGKLDYGALTHAMAAPPRDGDDRGFDDPLSATVRSIWADVLQAPDLGWQDSFFHLGGHSLLALTMLDTVGRALGVDLVVDTVFAHPRLGDFVTAVRSAQRSGPPAVAASGAGPADDVPASAAQLRFWYLHELDPDQPTYNMPGVLRLRGDLDEDALQAALRHVLRGHPVLTARFGTAGGGLTWTATEPEDPPATPLDLRGLLAELGDEAFDRYLEGEALRPFDLRRERPLRAVLARLAEDDWALIITIDHIACDGVSLSVFLGDLADAYNRLVRGLPPAQPTARYTFADFCREERRWLDARDPAEPSPWAELAAGPVTRSPLPPGTPDEGSGQHVWTLDSGVSRGVRDLAGRTGTTPFLVFASALSALMHSRGGGRETIMLGTLVAQRDRAEWQHVVGPLLNVSVVASRLSLSDTVGEALRRVRDGALLAYRQRHLPFQDLTAQLRTVADETGAPFDVMLVMQPPTEIPSFTGLAAGLTELEPSGAPYPLTVDVEPGEDAYRVSLRYDRARYADQDVKDLAARLADVLAAFVRAPAAALETIVPTGVA